MTNEELQAHLKALNDAATRGEIQFASFANPGGWLAIGTTFIDAKNYRIKPKPREIFVANFDLCKDATRFTAIHWPIEGQYCTKFREVIE